MITPAEHPEAFIACHRLATAELPPRRLRMLLDSVRMDSELPSLFALTASELTSAPFAFTEKQRERIVEAKMRTYGPKLLDAANALALRVVLYRDPEYPGLLRELDDAPPILFVRGKLTEADTQSVAIVGSRRTTEYGQTHASHFAATFATAGLTVVSGGAAGIDTAAHAATLNVPGGRTVVVLGCGLDTAYPADNRLLFQCIIADGRGALISEYPLGTEPEPWRFPARNRIIAGMSRATVIIETPEGSGALITAKNALEYNRDIWVVPGPIDKGRSRGGHRLIQDGAYLADSPDDVLRGLQVPTPDLPQPILPLPTDDESDVVSSAKRTRARRDVRVASNGSGKNVPATSTEAPVASPEAIPADLTSEEASLLAQLGRQPRHLDELSAAAGLSAMEASVAATFLSVKGLIRAEPGNLYVRVA